MGQRRIIEFNYSDFSSLLRRAAKADHKIEKTDKEAWGNYVRKYNVPEAAVMSRGKTGTMSGNVESVIIEGAGSADGYYVFSRDEQYCLKFEPGDEDG